MTKVVWSDFKSDHFNTRQLWHILFRYGRHISFRCGWHIDSVAIIRRSLYLDPYSTIFH